MTYSLMANVAELNSEVKEGVRLTGARLNRLFAFVQSAGLVRGQQHPWPDDQQGSSKILGTVLHPSCDLLRRKPTPCFNFLRIELEGAFGPAAVDPNVFLVRFCRGRKLEKTFGRVEQLEADFLLQLAHSARIIILPCVYMARSRGVPDAGLSILFH